MSNQEERGVYLAFKVLSAIGLYSVPVTMVVWFWVPGLWKISIAGLLVWLIFGFVIISERRKIDNDTLTPERKETGFRERLNKAIKEQERIRKIMNQ